MERGKIPHPVLHLFKLTPDNGVVIFQNLGDREVFVVKKDPVAEAGEPSEDWPKGFLYEPTVNFNQ